MKKEHDHAKEKAKAAVITAIPTEISAPVSNGVPTVVAKVTGSTTPNK